MIVSINALTLAVSEYNITAMDVVSHEGSVYFMTSDYLLRAVPPASANEGAVVSYVQTGDLDLAKGRRANIYRLYATLAADQTMNVTTIMRMEGQDRSVTYVVPQRSSTQPRAREVHLGRGYRAERWALCITTTADGGNWELGFLAAGIGQTERGLDARYPN